MPAASTNETISLTVDGLVYAGWTSVTVDRRLDRMSTRFTCSLTERWAGQGKMWQIAPFSPFVLKAGQDAVLTGYVDDYTADYDGGSHTVRVSGRSKTEDLIDCRPDITSGQFKGYNLEQIARAICQPFGIGVVVQTDATQRFPDATLQRCETALAFLERLARLSGVLLTDDAQGNLVLATAGTQRAATTLVQGKNILRAGAKLDVRQRFSDYIVKGQHAIGSASAAAELAPGFAQGTAPVPAHIAPVVTNMVARAKDAGVPRYRPTVLLAEAQLDQAGMQARANWERNYAFGRAIQAEITVQGWRQADSKLWQVNQLVSTTAPWLQIDQDLLIAGVKFSLDDRSGRTTTLQVGPVEGYTPDPGQVKLHCRRGKKGKTAPGFDGYGLGAAPDGDQ